MAKDYAGQQGFIEATGLRPQESVTSTVEDVVREMRDRSFGNAVRTGLSGAREYARGTLGALKARHGGGVVKAVYPARNFNAQPNPEIEILQEVARDNLGRVIPKKSLLNRTISAGVPRYIHRGTYGLGPVQPGGSAIPANYIKGSPHYQHTSWPEIKAHFQDVVHDPKRNIREALRNLTEL